MSRLAEWLLSITGLTDPVALAMLGAIPEESAVTLFLAIGVVLVGCLTLCTVLLLIEGDRRMAVGTGLGGALAALLMFGAGRATAGVLEREAADLRAALPNPALQIEMHDRWVVVLVGPDSVVRTQRLLLGRPVVTETVLPARRWSMSRAHAERLGAALAASPVATDHALVVHLAIRP